MAKVPVIFKVEDFKNAKGEVREREVASITYSFNQRVDTDGQVADIPRGGLIVIRMKALNKANSDLLNWMVSKKAAKNGTIEFYDTTNGNLMKKIEFENAYCVNYVEHWEDPLYSSHVAHWEEITISCKDIISVGITYHNEWNPLIGGGDD